MAYYDYSLVTALDTYSPKKPMKAQVAAAQQRLEENGVIFTSHRYFNILIAKCKQ